MFGTEHHRRETKALDFLPQVGNCYDQFRIGVLDLFGELRDGVERVCGGDDCASGENAEEANREVDGIGGEDENDVVFLDAQMEESMGDLDDGGFELREGESF